MGTIYIATNKNTGKQYVGQTINFPTRLAGHLKSNRYSYFGNSIRKHGKKNFIFEQLEYPDEELNQWEKYWILKLNTLSPNGYNHTTGGDYCKMSEETKAKIKTNNSRYWLGIKRDQVFRDRMRKINLGKKLSEEHKEKLQGRKPWNRGKETPLEVRLKQSMAAKKRIRKPCSEETKKKIGDAQRGEKNHAFGKSPHNKGKPCSNETKEKLSVALKGRKLSEETKINMRNAWQKNPLSLEARERISKAVLKRRELYGYINSPETREKLRIANTGKIVSEESKRKNREWHLGRKLTEEHKRNISIGNKGRVQSEETRKKMSFAHSGDKSSHAILTKSDVQNIRDKYIRGIKINSLAKEYSMNRKSISNIIRHRSWKYI